MEHYLLCLCLLVVFLNTSVPVLATKESLAAVVNNKTNNQPPLKPGQIVQNWLEQVHPDYLTNQAGSGSDDLPCENDWLLIHVVVYIGNDGSEEIQICVMYNKKPIQIDITKLTKPTSGRYVVPIQDLVYGTSDELDEYVNSEVGNNAIQNSGALAEEVIAILCASLEVRTTLQGLTHVGIVSQPRQDVNQQEENAKIMKVFMDFLAAFAKIG